ncbi:hypothetical protein D3C78_1126660 [compost metagenome]
MSGVRLAGRAHATGQARQGQGVGQRRSHLSLRRPAVLSGAAEAVDHPLRLAAGDGYRRPRRQDRRATGGQGAGEVAGRPLHPDLRAGGRTGRLRRPFHAQPAGFHRRQQAPEPGALHLCLGDSRCWRGNCQAAGPRAGFAGTDHEGAAGSADLSAGCGAGGGLRDPQLLWR